MLLFGPRGGVTHCVNLQLSPCDPRTDIKLINMEPRYCMPMPRLGMV